MEPVPRVASFDQLGARTAYALWRLRIDVFVVEQRCPYPELDGRDLEPGTRHVWIEVDDVPVAYLRVLREPDDSLRVGRVCVAEHARGRGLAADLMEAALVEAAGSVSVLDAQSYLARWYERFGYRVSGDEFVEDGIAHVPMRRD